MPSGCSVPSGPAGRLLGHVGQVRAQEDGDDAGAEDRVGPVVPVPAALLAGAAHAVQAWRATSTSRSAGASSDMIPSTPRSSSRCISAGSLTVQACTGRPRRCAAATNRRVDHPDPQQPGRHLGAAGVGPAQRAQPQREHPARAEADVHSRRPSRARTSGDEPVVERADADPVDRAGPAYRVDQRADRGRRLDVDVDPQVRVRAEQLVQPRHRLPAADPGPGHLGPGQLRGPRRCGRWSGSGVASCSSTATPSRVDAHVGLQVAEAERDDAVDRGEGVLQAGRGGAAVRERDRPAGVQERESRPHGDSMPDRDVRVEPPLSP